MSASTEQEQIQKKFVMNSALLVYGYIRIFTLNLNKTDNTPNEIIEIIHSFFRLIITSQILSDKDNIAFINEVASKFNKISQFQLLYSSLKHGLSKQNFKKYCPEPEINLIIIKNENGHIFGVYREYGNTDSFFLFVVSPKMHIFDEKGSRGVACFPIGQIIFNLHGSSIKSQDFMIYESLQDPYRSPTMIATTLTGCAYISNIDSTKMYGRSNIFDANGREILEMEVFTAIQYQSEPDVNETNK